MNKKITSLMATVAVAGLALTGCGSGTPSGSGDSTAADGTAGSAGASGELTEVTVGVLPTAASVGVQYGIEKGIFEEHGFDLELSSSNSGAAMLPAVSNQQITFGIGNPLSVMIAVDQGLDMRIVAGFANSWAEGDDIAGVFTRADSGIESYADLEGKTTAVNALSNTGDLAIMAAAAKEGADPSALQFTEMPFQDMQVQLEQGNVDAVWAPEPFQTMILQDEANVQIGSPAQATIPGLPSMVTFTSGAYAEENPEVVADFQEAMSAALAATAEDEKGARAMLPDFINLPEEIAQSITMEDLSGEIRTDQLSKIADLAVQYGVIDEAPNPAELYMQ